MTHLEWVTTKYDIAAKLQKSSVEIVPVQDDIGSQINALLKLLVLRTRDNPDLFTNLLDAMKALRWCLLTDTQPTQYNKRVVDALGTTIGEVGQLSGTVDHEMQTILDSIPDSCHRIQNNDSVIGTALLDSIREIGADNCVIVVASAAAQAGTDEWLQSRNMNVEVYTVGELMRLEHEVEQVYVVGPPAFFVSSIISSPVSYQISFLIPHWYKNTKLPASPISEYAEKPFRVKTAVHPFDSNGPIGPQNVMVDSTIPEEDLLPRPHWPIAEPDRQPQKEEVFARRVLLSKSLFCFLDDGERIRAYDPNQPVEDRLMNIPVNFVQRGTYLVLREDQNQQGVLYEEALDTFGFEKQRIIESQQQWKDALSNKLSADGAQVENGLDSLGVHAASRVEEWVDMTHIMPQRDSDFQLLLQFLGIEQQPTFEYAKQLRSKCQQLGWKMRQELETELSQINADELQRLRQIGYYKRQAENPLYRDIIIVRVLAVSPNREIVSRQTTRIPFEDEKNSAKWLE